MVSVSASVPGCVENMALARPMLFEALDCCERNDLVGAGCRLRESLKLLLYSAVEFYGVKIPPKRNIKKIPPKDLVKLLRKSPSAGLADEAGVWFLEIYDCGNRAAHLEQVDSEDIRASIRFLFVLIKGAPFGLHEEVADANDDHEMVVVAKGGPKS